MSADKPLPRAAWAALLAIYLALAFVFSIVQPLGRCPDETAHMQYVKFLADNQRLPFFEPAGGGEAGYEAQHPPLYYAIMAVVYRATAPLAERWRWHVMRWFTILLLGLPLFAISRRFFSEVLSATPWLVFVATASVMLMPLTLLYTAYPNPDAMGMLWAAGVLLLAVQRPKANPYRRAALLGLLSGAALLTKLSAAPVLVVALASHANRDETGRLRLGWATGLRWPPAPLTLAVALMVAGWWYARNALLYGTPLIHTTGLFGTGLEAGLRTSLWSFAWLTWKNTYLSSWAQPGWFPAGFWSLLLYGLIGLMTVGGLVGLVLQKRAAVPDDTALRSALNLSGLMLGLVFLGHQWAYWTMDVEFNMGGRYILVAMVGLVLLLLVGVHHLLGQRAKPVLMGWLVALLVMNVVSAWNILEVLNPRYAPGWRMFNFPGG